LAEGNRIHLEGKKSKRKADTVFERLVLAGRRLLSVIEKNRGGANKDLAKFTDQINNLANKWDR
ncbi:MAG: MBL fold metallo-hydrolase, partial [Clostridia bacterium]|nr:MBL fold metallo-hydrolase [Clostridia bacterium]